MMSETSSKPAWRRHAGSHRGSVATGAEHDGRRVRVEFVDATGELAHRNDQGSVEGAEGHLARVANVDQLQAGDVALALFELDSRHAGGPTNAIGMGSHHGERVLEETDNTIEADPGQTVLAFEFETLVDDQHDVDVGGDHRAGELRVPTVETDIDRAVEMCAGELFGVTAVDDHRSTGDELVEGLDVERRRQQRLVQQVTMLAVQDGVVDEILGCRGLPFGHEIDERLLVRRQQGVVRLPLLPHRRPRVGRQVLSAGRTGAVSGVDPGCVRKWEQLVVQAVVELIGELVTGEPDRRQQIGTADIADEERVTGEHAVGDCVACLLVHHDAERLRRVPWRVQELQLDLAERDSARRR